MAPTSVGKDVDFEHGLNAAVKRLRDTLADLPDTLRFIETVPVLWVSLIAQSQTAHALRRHHTATASRLRAASRAMWIAAGGRYPRRASSLFEEEAL
jgi:hypothetical protein